MRTIRTAKNRKRFLDVLQKGFSITAALRESGLGRTAIYAWRNSDEDFAKAWEDAIETGTDELEDRVLAKAYKMDEAFAMTGAIFLLKARRPRKYRDNYSIEHSGSIDIAGAKDRLMRILDRDDDA